MLRLYQPLLLRLVHGLTAFFVILAIITAYWTYDVYDGRWIQLSLPKFEKIEGIHGTFGLWSLLSFPTLVFYAFHHGKKRLIQPNTWQKLTEISQKGWWYHLHRLVNTLMLFSLAFAVFTGKMMDEKWLPNEELNHFWYYAHLLSWIMILVGLAWHLLMSAKIGGLPLLLSMINRSYKPQDSPANWRSHLRKYRKNFQVTWIKRWWDASSWMKWLEVSIWMSLGMAWIIPLFKQ